MIANSFSTMIYWLAVFLFFSFLTKESSAAEAYLLESQLGKKLEVYVYGKEEGRLLCMGLQGEAMVVEISNLSDASIDLVSKEVAEGRPKESLAEFRFRIADNLTRLEVRDRKQTSALFLKSAEEGHAEAQARISIGYYIGSGVDEDAFAAFRWAEKSAKGGSLEGKLCLGLYLYRGFGTTQDPRRSKLLLHEVASSGSKRAHYLLGDAYSMPIDSRDYDLKKSIYHYKESIGNAWWRDSTQRLIALYEDSGIPSFSGVIAYATQNSLRLQQIRMGRIGAVNGASYGSSSSSIPRLKLLSDSATIQPIDKVTEREAISKRVSVFRVDQQRGLWEVFGIGDRIITATATEVPQIDWASWERDMELWRMSRKLDELEANYNNLNNNLNNLRSRFW